MTNEPEEYEDFVDGKWEDKDGYVMSVEPIIDDNNPQPWLGNAVPEQVVREMAHAIDESRYTPARKEPWRFNEAKLLNELGAYISDTYGGHYGAGGKIQSLEVAIDRGRGLEGCLFNVDKYSGRYGHKGDVKDHRKDLMKIAHYALLALYCHDLKYGEDQ